MGTVTHLPPPHRAGSWLSVRPTPILYGFQLLPVIPSHLGSVREYLILMAAITSSLSHLPPALSLPSQSLLKSGDCHSAAPRPTLLLLICLHQEATRMPCVLQSHSYLCSTRLHTTGLLSAPTSQLPRSPRPALLSSGHWAASSVPMSTPASLFALRPPSRSAPRLHPPHPDFPPVL